MPRHFYASPTLPGFTAPGTYAAWPVWSNSTTKEIRFTRMPKKAAVKLWHKAREFERQTRQPGKRGGALGFTALRVLESLLFDFLNYQSGRLDPSQPAIARKAGICERAVRTGLSRLRELGILNWIRRCAESWEDGRFLLKQETNAYAILPSTQWRGFWTPPEPPSPHPSTWGATPPLAAVLAQAADMVSLESYKAAKEEDARASARAAIAVLDSDPTDELALALARYGRSVLAKDSQ